ncbi:MAG: hypothetical protein VKJ46_15595 [Leptolyngbyaceae bacterium]|nr:hypothetical protein [Leptolyngbyaceae bacterium]
MSRNPLGFNSDGDTLQSLNAEIDDLYKEVEELHQETAILMGLMSGSCAYFLQQLMVGHRQETGLSAEACEQIVVNALKRIVSSQERFGYDFLAEIQAVLQKMSRPIALDPYLEQVIGQQKQ